jgi:hypothetical protein
VRRLVAVQVEGKYRAYRLAGTDVAAALEALSVVAGAAPTATTPTAPTGLRAARTCYDHLATERRPHLRGALGAAVLNLALGKAWVRRQRDSRALTITNVGRGELLSKFGVRA